MTIKQIRDLIEKEVGFDISVRTRKMDVAKYRFMFYYIAFKYADDCFKEVDVANELGYDRVTARYGINEFPNLLPYDSTLVTLFDKIQDMAKKSTSKIFKVRKELDSLKDIKAYNELILLRKKYKKLKEENKNLKKQLR